MALRLDHLIEMQLRITVFTNNTRSVSHPSGRACLMVFQTVLPLLAMIEHPVQRLGHALHVVDIDLVDGPRSPRLLLLLTVFILQQSKV